MTRLDEVRARFAGNAGLPFADVRTEGRIRDALAGHGARYRDRVFGPVATVWGFLSQVLSEDHRCRDAVARVIAHRAAAGLAACSPRRSRLGPIGHSPSRPCRLTRRVPGRRQR